MKINKLRMLASDKGFTLIELMIVIAIIGILAAIAIPNFISYRDKSFCSAVESDAGSIQGGLADYFSIPSNQSFATVTNKTAIQFPGSQTIALSGDNTASVTSTVGTTTFIITVTDGSKRCPVNYQKSNLARWSATVGGTYTVTM